MKVKRRDQYNTYKVRSPFVAACASSLFLVTFSFACTSTQVLSFTVSVVSLTERKSFCCGVTSGIYRFDTKEAATKKLRFPWIFVQEDRDR
jgi:hypothetical protein